MLRPDEFSGGEAPGQANFVLRGLGFAIAKKESAEDGPTTGTDWTEHEVRLVVADCFEMLDAELAGRTFRKSEHLAVLSARLAGRSGGSIESVFRNISGVLVERGMPCIDGYKPLSNHQAILAVQVETFLDEHPELLERLAASPLLDPPAPQPALAPDLAKVIEAPPDTIHAPSASSRPWLSRKGARIDFAERDARNRRLGQLAEQFVFELEKSRLAAAGRDDLVRRVTWASREWGDGLGFDVLSFCEADDSERLLEVKGTGLGKFSPFYVTSNEVRCSEDVPRQYQLWRVFDFGRSPRLYILHGSLRELCRLEPVLFRASL